jgi:hypothetical protein
LRAFTGTPAWTSSRHIPRLSSAATCRAVLPLAVGEACVRLVAQENRRRCLVGEMQRRSPVAVARVRVRALRQHPFEEGRGHTLGGRVQRRALEGPGGVEVGAARHRRARRVHVAGRRSP